MIATREYINALDFANIDYVDTSAANTLKAAKAYADENGGAVSSVNGEVGDVQLTAAKVGAATKEEMDTLWNFMMAAKVGATTPEDVTAAIREQSLGGIWDAELQVWWTPRMKNGSLTYEATTNVNLNAEN